MRPSSEAHPTALSDPVGMRCRAVPEFPLSLSLRKHILAPVQQRMSGPRVQGRKKAEGRMGEGATAGRKRQRRPYRSGPSALSRGLSEGLSEGMRAIR